MAAPHPGNRRSMVPLGPNVWHACAVTDLTRMLLGARRVMAGELDAEFADRGYPELRPSHAAPLLGIDRRTGSRITDLADEAHVTKQAMMAVVDDLESHGYVRRVPDPRDARAKLVRLTAAGRTAAAECRRAVTALDQRTRGRLGDRAYESLVASLDELSVPEDDDES